MGHIHERLIRSSTGRQTSRLSRGAGGQGQGQGQGQGRAAPLASRRAPVQDIGAPRGGRRLARRPLSLRPNRASTQAVASVIPGPDRRVGRGGIGAGRSMPQVISEAKPVSRRGNAVRRRTQQPRSAWSMRRSRHAAGDQRVLRRPGSQDRPWADGRRSTWTQVSTAELLLRRPDRRAYQISQVRADRSSAKGEIILDLPTARWRTVGIIPPASGARMPPSPPPRPASDQTYYRPQTASGVRVDGDRLRVPTARAGGRRGLSAQAARHPALSWAPATAKWRKAPCAAGHVNISMRKVGDNRLGNPLRVKNVNSIRAVQQGDRVRLRFGVPRSSCWRTAQTVVQKETGSGDPNPNGPHRASIASAKEEAPRLPRLPDPDLLRAGAGGRVLIVSACGPELPERRTRMKLRPHQPLCVSLSSIDATS